MTDTISLRWCDGNLICMKRRYCLVLDEAAYYEECNRYGVPIGDQGVWISPGSHATVTYATSAAGEPLALVAVDVDGTRTPIQIAGLLVHEAVHLVQRFCSDIGEHQPGAEFQAYATQWIAQELMEQYSAQVVNPKG